VSRAVERVADDVTRLARNGLTHPVGEPSGALGAEPEWRHGLRSGLYRLEADLYACGNAE
jgi:hypothetical protein